MGKHFCVLITLYRENAWPLQVALKVEHNTKNDEVFDNWYRPLHKETITQMLPSNCQGMVICNVQKIFALEDKIR